MCTCTLACSCDWTSSTHPLPVHSLNALALGDVQVLFVPAPCIRLKPKMADQLSTTNHYNCPLYRTAERRGTLATTGHSTNFVMFVKMPTDQAASHWIMRGVALLSALSD
eukprot:1159394-Pelagomonas_calceolata.AAC.4